MYYLYTIYLLLHSSAFIYLRSLATWFGGVSFPSWKLKAGLPRLLPLIDLLSDRAAIHASTRCHPGYGDEVVVVVRLTGGLGRLSHCLPTLLEQFPKLCMNSVSICRGHVQIQESRSGGGSEVGTGRAGRGLE